MSVKEARDFIADEFKKDPNFRMTYTSNVAMLLYDRFGITGYQERNDIANAVIELIFEK